MAGAWLIWAFPQQNHPKSDRLLGDPGRQQAPLSPGSARSADISEKKYGAPFDSVKQDKRYQGAEDFALEDDLPDWEYARATLQWWQGQLRE
uniref:Uncharacterized protein n=1 Tax=Candidatus Kentrum sp. DK TaxID=2126562 RepID=A0A450RZT5_9GAMM|nr:MAG: hypothetical protein BECKDK2373C_GA0170839_100962 [Candidatus Kentron sp. DK]